MKYLFYLFIQFKKCSLTKFMYMVCLHYVCFVKFMYILDLHYIYSDYIRFIKKFFNLFITIYKKISF